MSAVLNAPYFSFPTHPNPQRKDWFDEVPARPTLAAERRFRQEQLAVAFRLFAQLGLAHGLAGHITARDPEWSDHFWVNPLGVHFSQIKVSDLLLVNAAGEIVVGEGPLDDYTGAMLETDEGFRIDQMLGPRKAVILKNHGILTGGPGGAHFAFKSLFDILVREQPEVLQ